MKYKKLIIWLCSIAAALVLITILLFTVFRVHSVELVFKNETTIFQSEEKQKEVIERGKINYSIPIFAINKKEIIDNLELKNYYLKVINIETVFPNKLVIHCAEREELFCIKSSDNMYYIVDDEFKVLSKTKNPSFGQNNATVLDGVVILNQSAQEGEFLQIASGSQELKSISNAFMSVSKNISDIKAMFKQITLSFEINYYTLKSAPVLTFVTYDDFEIRICGADNFLKTKVNIMLTLIPEMAEYYKTHRIVLDINPDDITDVYVVRELKQVE